MTDVTELNGQLIREGDLTNGHEVLVPVDNEHVRHSWT